MDQKRMLLALALSVGLMFGWVLLFGDKQQPPQTQAPKPAAPAQKDARTKPAPGGEAKTATAPAAPATQPKAAAPTAPAGRPVTVTTPLFIATFNTTGGALQKVVLKDYYNHPGKKGGHFAVLDLKKPEHLALSLSLPQLGPQAETLAFAPSAESLNLTSGRQSLTFSAVYQGVRIEKIYTFSAGSYAWNLQVRLTNNSGRKLELQPALNLTEDKNRADSASYAFTGMQYIRDGKYFEEDGSDLNKKPSDGGAIKFMALSIPYFMGALVPLDPAGSAPIKRYVKGNEISPMMYASLVDSALSLEAGHAAELNYLVFYGPKDLKVLEPLGHDLARAVDFGWFDIIAKPMLAALNFCDSFIGNYGLAIILVTLLTKLIFWPLTKKSYKSMKEMQKLQPHVAKIRERYKNDKQRMNQEIMQLYKTYKVNPAGGCLPMVVQIPVFIAFYKVLGSAIELRHAPFFLWINDLSVPDRLPIGFQIPYVGDGLPVLTLLMGASMFIQQKMTPTTGDPTQAKMMMLMPVVFTVMFINFPAGLVLYWLVNNIFSIGQQYLTNRSKK